MTGAVLAILVIGACGLVAISVRGRPVTALRRPEDRLVALPQGTTRSIWSGPEGGPVVIAVHGLTTPSEVFAPLADRLADQGVRMLRYDLFGRGGSDPSTDAETAAFFVRQLSDLLDAEGVDGPICLLGYSMGGAIAAVFAARYPDRVSRLVLLAPAGMSIDLSPFWRRARDLGIGGDLLVALWGKRALRGQIDPAGPIAQVQYAQAERRDFPRSVLSSLRGALSISLEAVHRRIAGLGIPVLAIWGGLDRTIPGTALGRLAHWNKRATHETFDDADHALPVTHADRIAALLARELQRPDPVQDHR